MFDSCKPSGCAPSSGTCSKLHVETCIPLGDGDLHTSCTTWLSASFLQHADYSGIGRVWHTIGVTGRRTPGLSCSGPRSFHKWSMNGVSFYERRFLCNSGLLIPATNRSRRATSKCSWKLHLDGCCCMRTTNSRTASLALWTLTLYTIAKNIRMCREIVRTHTSTVAWGFCEAQFLLKLLHTVQFLTPVITKPIKQH